MRSPRIRFTVQGLMIAVAAAALMIRARDLLLLSREYQAIAAAHAADEALWRSRLAALAPPRPVPLVAEPPAKQSETPQTSLDFVVAAIETYREPEADSPTSERSATIRCRVGYPADPQEYQRVYEAQVAYHEERVRYFNTQRRTYERLARYPWLTVPPDPPEPK